MTREDEAAAGGEWYMFRDVMILWSESGGLALLKREKHAVATNTALAQEDEEKDKFACIKKSIRDNLVSHVWSSETSGSLLWYKNVRSYLGKIGVFPLSPTEPEGYTSCQAGSNWLQQETRHKQRLSCYQRDLYFCLHFLICQEASIHNMFICTSALSGLFFKAYQSNRTLKSFNQTWCSNNQSNWTHQIFS